MAISVIDKHEAAMKEAYGLRTCRARVCPRTVAGRRCVDWTPAGEQCICQRHHLDHSRIWLNSRSEHVFTFEPYDLRGKDMEEILADIRSLGGVEARVLGRSPWVPGATFLVMVERADPQEARRAS